MLAEAVRNTQPGGDPEAKRKRVSKTGAVVAAGSTRSARR